MRGNGEWLGVEMGDPVGGENSQAIRRIILFQDVITNNIKTL